jgi:hypothetical protein
MRSQISSGTDSVEYWKDSGEGSGVGVCGRAGGLQIVSVFIGEEKEYYSGNLTSPRRLG